MYENLFQKMELGVVYHRSDGKITDANPAAEKILGFSANEMNTMDSHSKEWHAIKKDGTAFPGDEHPAMIALQTGTEVRNVVMGIFHPVKERQVWIAIDAVPEFKESEKQPFRVFATFKDITSELKTKTELEKSHERLHFAMDAGDHGFWDWNLDTDEVYFSPQYFRMLGYEPDRYAPEKNTGVKLIHPEDRKTVMPEIDKCVKNAKPFALEFRMKCKNGSWKWILSRGKNYQTDKNGVPRRAVGVQIDIDELKRSEEQQKRLSQRLEAGLRAGDLAWWEMELPSGKVTFDDRKAEMLGYSPESFKTFEDFTALIHQDDYEKAMQAMRDYLSGDAERYEVEYRIKTSSGEYKWFKDIGAITEHNKTTGSRRVIGIVENITKRKHAEEELRKSERFNREIISSVNEGIIVYDSQFRYVMWNPFMEKISGMYANEVLGRKAYNMFPFILEQGLDQLLNRAFAGEIVTSGDIPFNVPSTGAQGWIVYTYAPHRDAYGNIIGVIATLFDITERKEMEQKMLKNTIQTEERERSRIARELHDGIGPLLSTIKLFMHTYIDSNSQEYKERVKTDLFSSIDEAINQVSVISNNLSPQMLKEFGLKKAMEKFTKKIMRASALDISFNCDLNHRLTYEIEITLYRITTELINNTLKYAEATEIEIAIHKEQDRIHLSYTDNGKGFEKEDKDKIEAGMGLFNIQNRIKSLQGHIKFKNNPHNGVRFDIMLPVNPKIQSDNAS